MGSVTLNTKNSQVLLLGLEDTGKTTFLKRVVETIKPNKEDSTIEPTFGFNFASLTISTVNFDIWDLGGDQITRDFWSTFYRTLKINLVIFFIDITNPAYLESSLKELLRIINEEELKLAKFYIIFNCFLPNNTVFDDNVAEYYKDEAEFVLKQLKEYPIHEYEARVDWDIIDIKKANFTEALLGKYFNYIKVK